MLKRSFDIVFSALCLLVLAPLMLVIAILVWLESPGAIIYRGPRIGRGGTLLEILKFRTMRELSDGSVGPRITADDDPRLTRLGRFLRYTKLNELLQLINVLRGEMTLVGPRPEDPSFLPYYTDEQRQLLSLRPGITGMASLVFVDEEKLLRTVNASETYVRTILPKKLSIELQYLKHQSFILDMEVLFRTFVVLVPGCRMPTSQAILLNGPIRKLSKALTWILIGTLIAFGTITACVAPWGIEFLGSQLRTITLTAVAIGASASLCASLFKQRQAKQRQCLG